ncbi:HpcH/HpaI aldolase/citrate lyase family protein [Trinickia fusca]|uniref:CoA ester lyase n=1 Tax=Trinickia fusca TaxID=2419777 RepID=A0A494XKY2_9BURK|nr:CoA ester lyase [Trinickia fusca]RKP49306.1 CoA ester lyase [Trinickia fusca]
MSTKFYARSILYTPALDVLVLKKAQKTAADICLLDIEDSVPPVRKEDARRLCIEILQAWPKTRPTAVRINEIRSPEFLQDIAAFVAAKVVPDIIVMTMVDSGVEVEILRTLLGRQHLFPEIYVTIETPASIKNLEDIARESNGLILGSADLAASLGVDIDWDNMLYARQRLVVAAARYEIAAIDTACFNFEGSAAELQEESRRCVSLGYHGKVAVHPAQVPVINEIFEVKDEALDWARRVIETWERAGGGVERLGDRMIGPPFVKKAQQLLRRASGRR